MDLLTAMTSDSRTPLNELSLELYQALPTLAGPALFQDARLDATDLVHQAWILLANSETFQSMPRSDFLALCATMMRRIAVDEGRRRLKENHDPERITLSGLAADEGTSEVDLLALDGALDQLKTVDDRWAHIVELRFFGGLTEEEVGEVMGISRRTVIREWILARAWLSRKLS